MKINNSPAQQINHLVSKTNQKAEESVQKQSSGIKTDKASRDPAGLTLALSLNAKSKAENVHVRQSQDSLSMLQIEAAGLEGQQDLLLDMRDLALQASNGVYGPQEREHLNAEFLSLQETLYTQPSAQLQNHLEPKDLHLNNVESSSEAIESIDQSIQELSKLQTENGAQQSVLQHQMNHHQTMGVVNAEAASRIQDTDYGEEVIESAIASAQLSTQVAMLSQANQKLEDVSKLIE